MVNSGYLIIDDIDESLAMMTAVGRSVVSGPANIIRSHVLDFAARRGWTVSEHSEFDNWARKIVRTECKPWVVLDPLFRTANDADRLKPLRISRTFVPGRFETSAESLRTLFFAPGTTQVGIIDDIASSGQTLQYASRILGQADQRIGQVLLCAASTQARHALNGVARPFSWKSFVSGDWRAIHLRDGCPHLPFTVSVKIDVA